MANNAVGSYPSLNQEYDVCVGLLPLLLLQLSYTPWQDNLYYVWEHAITVAPFQCRCRGARSTDNDLKLPADLSSRSFAPSELFY